MAVLRIALLAIMLLVSRSALAQDSKPAADWPYASGTIDGQRFSPLADITKDNVKSLKVAWTFHTGDYSPGDAKHSTTAFEVAPLEIEGTLYICTPTNQVIALDPETGNQKWRFDPKTSQATKVGFRVLEDGRKVRVAKASGNVIEG